VLLWPAVASAQGQRLTYQDALARALDAPAVQIARAATDEVRARRVGAGLRWQTNPEIGLAAGPRSGPGTIDVDASLRQGFEPRGLRAARLAGVDAVIGGAEADTAAATREVVHSVAAAFFEGLYYQERVALLRSALDAAQEVARGLEQRYRAGDVPVLDVNLARNAAARASADLAVAEAKRQAALGVLAEQLGLQGSPVLDGRLADHLRARDTGALLARADEDPALGQLRAEQLEASADLRASAALARPEFGVSATYQRDEGANIVLGGLNVSLPVFSKGQDLAATATARARRMALAVDLTRRAIDTRIRRLADAHAALLAVVSALERDALPGLDDSEGLARRSYETGQVALVEWLLLRRELLDTRLFHLDQLFAVAVAGADVDSAAGVLR
jgi:cobalt-zinc-cadmium efflux system outer membrane protein